MKRHTLTLSRARAIIAPTPPGQAFKRSHDVRFSALRIPERHVGRNVACKSHSSLLDAASVGNRLYRRSGTEVVSINICFVRLSGMYISRTLTFAGQVYLADILAS